MGNFFNTESILNRGDRFFIGYILIQPLLDLTAYLGWPISDIFRILALVFGFLYLLFYRDKKVKWAAIIYFFLLGIFMLINFINNLVIKSNFHLIEELTYSIKTIYVIGMLLIYTAVILSISKQINWKFIIQRNISINMIVIGLVMVVANITGTGKRSYDMLTKYGHSGWFFSANELSAILAMGFGIMVLYILEKEKTQRKWQLFLIPLIVWSMMTLGTKVGIGSAFIALLLGVFISLYKFVKQRREWLNVTFLTALTLLSFLIIPYTAAGNNLKVKPFFYNPGEDKLIPAESLDGQLTSTKYLSGRDQFLKSTIEDYQEAPLSQKLLGMGPGGNYENGLKLIEMDFLDWFFSYGIIGSILLFAPLLYYGIVIVKSLFQHKFKQVTPAFLMFGLEIGLGVGIAFFAGHIFLNPSSGIYFSILLSYLYVLATKTKVLDKRSENGIGSSVYK